MLICSLVSCNTTLNCVGLHGKLQLSYHCHFHNIQSKYNISLQLNNPVPKSENCFLLQWHNHSHCTMISNGPTAPAMTTDECEALVEMEEKRSSLIKTCPTICPVSDHLH
jgi:hypothetical protein